MQMFTSLRLQWEQGEKWEGLKRFEGGKSQQWKSVQKKPAMVVYGERLAEVRYV